MTKMFKWVMVSMVLVQGICAGSENWGQWCGREGSGISTPIVWGEQVLVQTAIKTEKVDAKLPKLEDQPERVFGTTRPNTSYEFVVLCSNRETGEEMWWRKAGEEIPREGQHRGNPFASSSPTTNGKRL